LRSGLGAGSCSFAMCQAPEKARPIRQVGETLSLPQLRCASIKVVRPAAGGTQGLTCKNYRGSITPVNRGFGSCRPATLP
jgi:hypothetical protein